MLSHELIQELVLVAGNACCAREAGKAARNDAARSISGVCLGEKGGVGAPLRQM
jgi:hypothetical protein